MKNLFKLPIAMLYLIVLVSCSTDPPELRPLKQVVRPQVPEEVNDDDPEENNDDPEENNDDPEENTNDDASINFGFLNWDGISNTYLDLPIESSTTHLFVGRWRILKISWDDGENSNTNFYNYQDYAHRDCGQSFLQFNNDGVIFENNYYKSAKECTLHVAKDKWELIEENRFKISFNDLIYLDKVTDSVLILKFDWRGTDWHPLQVYYHYERIQPAD